MKRQETLPNGTNLRSGARALSFQKDTPSTGLEFNGRRMRVMSTDATGVVSSDTILVFEQIGKVVSARYRGGSIVDGYLIGLVDGDTLQFRYVQVDDQGNLDAGVSTGTIECMADGRLRLIERFRWLTRPGEGTNVFEEILP
ncbi:MAG TPA: hypothetical protein VK578_25020 [Edaphobacter sp.]|nr:hypothetical protein [Edaphobacter sp.]